MDPKEPKVKSILISQPEPADGKSPYFDLKEKYKVQVSFRPFTHVEAVPAKDFRKDKISIIDHTAVILSSRASIEHFFRICEEMRVDIPVDLKYFCLTEAIALYLQKFITYRKRKVFYPKVKDTDIFNILAKHKNENYLFPCSNIGQSETVEFLRAHKLKFDEAIIYKTVSSDLSDLSNVNYDVIAFFGPTGIKSLFDNFPDFKQNNTRIAAFGPITCKAVLDAGLTLNIEAPTAETPSMKMALEQYIKRVNK
jgi:uroporphyrinogen-III synthase